MVLQLYFMDISPNFSAVLFGFALALATSAGVIDGSLLGYLIQGVVSSFKKHFRAKKNNLICEYFSNQGNNRTMENPVYDSCLMSYFWLLLFWLLCGI